MFGSTKKNKNIILSLSKLIRGFLPLLRQPSNGFLIVCPVSYLLRNALKGGFQRKRNSKLYESIKTNIPPLLEQIKSCLNTINFSKINKTCFTASAATWTSRMQNMVIDNDLSVIKNKLISFGYFIRHHHQLFHKARRLHRCNCIGLICFVCGQFYIENINDFDSSSFLTVSTKGNSKWMLTFYSIIFLNFFTAKF